MIYTCSFLDLQTPPTCLYGLRRSKPGITAFYFKAPVDLYRLKDQVDVEIKPGSQWHCRTAGMYTSIFECGEHTIQIDYNQAGLFTVGQTVDITFKLL